MNIGIIGAGNWGTTLAIYLAREKKNPPILYEFFEEKAEPLKKERENQLYLPGYHIPESITITSNPEELVEESEIIFLVQPSHTIRNISSIFKNYITDETIASFSKGIDSRSLQRISEIITDEIPQQKDRIVVVSGPSIAREVIKGIPTSMVAASKQLSRATTIQHLLSSDTMRIYTSTDIVGVELGGALKNVYAIAAGICDGLELGVNAKAALLTRATTELSRLGIKMGGKKETFAGLSGFGDLIVTSFSKDSRNRTVGERLGKGEKLDEILDEMVEVAEGIRTTHSIYKLSKKLNVEMPIAEQVYKVLFEGKDFKASIETLMRRKLKREQK